MYFNAYFKEMKIGAQREAQQSWSSCVQLALGQAALQWPHAKLWAACTWAACPHTLPLAAPLHQAVSPCSAGLWAGGQGVRRRRESWHCPWATPLPGGSLFLERKGGAVLDGMWGSAPMAAARCSNASNALTRSLRTQLACLRQLPTMSVTGWACLSLSHLQIPKQMHIPLQ